MILYHGTSAEHLPNILKEGLKPRGVTGNSVYKGDELSHPDFIYLTRTFPVAYAYSIIGVKKIVILKIEVDEKDFYPDEDYVERAIHFATGNKINLSSIDPSDHKDSWDESLRLLHSVCVKQILPEQIVGHVTLDTGDHDLHCGLGAQGNLQQKAEGLIAGPVPPEYAKRLELLFTRGWGYVKKDIMKDPPSTVMSTNVRGALVLKSGSLYRVLLEPGDLEVACFVCDAWSNGRPVIDKLFKHFFQVPVGAVKRYKQI